MPYLTCPQCRATYHAGMLHVQHDSCPRCGAQFTLSQRGFRDQLTSAVIRRRPSAPALDWEAITNSQYARRQYVTRPEPDAGLESEQASEQVA